MSAKLRKYLEDQAECIARINDEWLLWPSEAHSREKADAIEGKIVSILGSDSTLGRITARDGTVLLFWCASPSEAQREQVATLEEVARVEKETLHPAFLDSPRHSYAGEPSEDRRTCVETKEMLIHPYSSLKLYEIQRLDVAVRHVLGLDMRVRTSTATNGAMFIHWLAWLDDEQVAAVLEIDGIEEIYENVEWPDDMDVGTSR